MTTHHLLPAAAVFLPRLLTRCGANCTRIGSHERHPAAPYDFRNAARPLGG
jgi:hypothetical protein